MSLGLMYHPNGSRRLGATKQLIGLAASNRINMPFHSCITHALITVFTLGMAIAQVPDNLSTHRVQQISVQKGVALEVLDSRPS